MTPTVPRTLAEEIHQQLVGAGVVDTAHAVRVLALHAQRILLTREDLAEVVARFEPYAWDLTTTAAAERLLTDRGEEPDAALLAYEVGQLHGRNRLRGTPSWPADTGPPDPDPWAGGTFVQLAVRTPGLRAKWADHISRVCLEDRHMALGIHIDVAQARAIGWELIAAADAGDAALAARVAEAALAETAGPGADGDRDQDPTPDDDGGSWR